MENHRIYIVAKTYPVISRKYTELVCTAGVFEDGSWVRLYPIPFRNIENEKQFRKYSWIDVSVERRTEDFRPETYRPDLSTLRAEVNSLSPRAPLKEEDWEERKSIIFRNKEIFTNKQHLIELAKDSDNPVSLAIFKPSKVLDFRIAQGETTWDPDVLKSLERQAR